MSYTLNLTNGSSLIPGGLSDGSIDTSSTSLYLVGKNYAGYGQFINQNFIKLLENFSNPSSPPNPLRGQLWWDTLNNVLRVYSGTSWKISTGATSSPAISPPGDLSTLGGDLWFDSTNSQLKVYSGDNWITVGPVQTPGTGDTGFFPALMSDTSSSTHITMQLKISGVIYAVWSKEPFVSALAGFGTVKAGLNFSTIASPVLELGTQDVSANPNTLVFRDSGGGIAATSLAATSISASAITASTFTGLLAGDVTGNVSATTIASTTVSAAAIVSSGGIVATSGFSGTLLTAAQPNITTVGNIYNLSTNGNTRLTGYATYNGSEIATLGGSASFSSINSTPIGNVTPSTGAFTTVSASSTTVTGNISGNVVSTVIIAGTISAGTIGNVGAIVTGTLSTAIQPNITTATSLTSVGLVSVGTWRGNIIQPAFGGTGVNNGSNTLTVTGGSIQFTGPLTFNQSVASAATPVFTGTNFTGIPNAALTNSGITINGQSVSLGGSVTLPATVGNLLAGTGVTVSNPTGNVTVSIGQAVGTSSSVQFASTQLSSLGVGVAASGTAGEIRATNNVTAYYTSDKKFKENINPITNALYIVEYIGGKTFDWTDEYVESHGGEDGYFVSKSDFGVIAQDVQAVFPKAVKTKQDGSLAVDYVKLCSLAFQAIIELKAELNSIKNTLSDINNTKQ